MSFSNNNDSGVTGAAKFATSTVGNTVGGLLGTAGDIVGVAGRGVGDTVTGATGSAGKPLGKALADVGNGVQDGTNRLAQGVKDKGQWK